MAPQGRKKRKAGQTERSNRTARDSKLGAAEERRIKARLKLLNSRLQLINRQALNLTTGCEQAALVRRALNEHVGAQTSHRVRGKFQQ